MDDYRNFREALKRQHFAALKMFRQAIERCPDSLWISGIHPRTFWRIAYHALGYFHLYLFNSVSDWKPWDKHDVANTYLDGEVDVATPYAREEILTYIDQIEAEIAPAIDAMDLEAPNVGFTWYPNVTRFELCLLSLRHFHGHLGQLHELLLAEGEDIEWIGELTN